MGFYPDMNTKLRYYKPHENSTAIKKLEHFSCKTFIVISHNSTKEMSIMFLDNQIMNIYLCYDHAGMISARTTHELRTNANLGIYLTLKCQSIHPETFF